MMPKTNKDLYHCLLFGILKTAATVERPQKKSPVFIWRWLQNAGGIEAVQQGESVFAKLLMEGVNNVSLLQAQTRVSKESLLLAANSGGPGQWEHSKALVYLIFRH